MMAYDVELSDTSDTATDDKDIQAFSESTYHNNPDSVESTYHANSKPQPNTAADLYTSLLQTYPASTNEKIQFQLSGSTRPPIPQQKEFSPSGQSYLHQY